MIDFHTHILPRMDDGSRRMAETQKMLKMEYDQGVRQIVASSHFYAQNEFPETFLDRRERRLVRVREMMKEEQWGHEMQIFGGAEVLYYSGMADSPMLHSLCIDGTDQLLLELPFMQWDREVYYEVKKIVENQKIKVILAHIERYYNYQKDKEIWDELLELPLTIQLNAGEMLAFSYRKLCKNLLNSDIPVLLGTDCHNIGRRKPNMEKGRRAVEKLAGAEKLQEIERFGEQVLNL